MYINRAGEVKVRIRGIDQAIRWTAGCNETALRGAQKGAVEAAEYLMAVIKEKFGTYQSTGGTGGGPWAKLKFETIARKLREFGVGDKPLIASGSMKDSFYIKPGGSNAISASVVSKDDKLLHHIYGAPRRGVPKRDPMLVTALEEEDMCHDIVEDAVNAAMDKFISRG